MANKRTLKQVINQISEELIVECVAASLYGNEKHPEDTEALLSSIIKMQSDYISRVSHPEPGMKASQYFNNLRESFTKQVSEIVDQINNL